MNVLIKGSHRKNSISQEIALKYVDSDLHIVDVNKLNIIPCCGCDFCTKNDKCAISNDDMSYIYKILGKTTNLTITSPLYFGQLSSKLLTLISRMQLYFSQQYVCENKMLSIDSFTLYVSAGNRYDDMFNGLTSFIKSIRGILNCSKITVFTIDNTDKGNNKREIYYEYINEK